MKQSKGHLLFTPDESYEYYEQNGQVFRAYTGNAFDLDGYRHGRWECSKAHFERNRSQYEGESCLHWRDSGYTRCGACRKCHESSAEYDSGYRP